MIAEQQRASSRDKEPSPKDDRSPRARGTSWLDAKLDAAASDATRFRWFMIVSAIVALAWVGFVATLVVRSMETPPETIAPPPLALAPLPAPADTSDSPSQTIDSGSLPVAGPTPDAVEDAAPPPAAIAASGKVPTPPVRKAPGKNDAAPAPKRVAALSPAPAKLITVTIRTFHPPVISSAYKDMVADKMKEEGIDARLEAKVRSGRQLTKEDLASVPKPVMERMNIQVVAYGQPPLYTDTVTTVPASAAR